MRDFDVCQRDIDRHQRVIDRVAELDDYIDSFNWSDEAEKELHAMSDEELFDAFYDMPNAAIASAFRVIIHHLTDWFPRIGEREEQIALGGLNALRAKLADKLADDFRNEHS